ncbi:hypothetical protein JW992_00295 [candidate division KSB1 bacterium]|nr:hypothetical protein [candidate division KSB1 bacterium]
MYTKRNTLTLLILVVLFGTIGTTWYVQEVKTVKELQQQNDRLAKQFHGMELVVQTLESVEGHFAELKDRWGNAPKKILAVEEPAFTISYINWLIQNYRLDLSFDFFLNDFDKKQEISTFSFTLNGEASYRDLYAFLWYLTKNPLLYKIENFTLAKNGQENRLSFKLQIRGFFLMEKWEMDHDIRFTSFENEMRLTDYHNVFGALIVQAPRALAAAPSRAETTTAAPAPKTLYPNIEEAVLLALTSDKVYIKEKNSKVTILATGDRVDNGILERIDLQKSEAHFTLQTQNGRRTVILGLGYTK